MKELFYLKKYFLKYKKRLLIGTFFVICANVFKVLSPKILGNAIDLVMENLKLFASFEGFDSQKILISFIEKNILFFSVAFLVIALISGLFTFLMRQSIIVMSRLIENDLRNDIYAHYQEMDQAFYKRNNTGDLMNRATEDVAKVRMFLGPALMYSINVFMLFSFVIYSMLQIDVEYTFWVLLPMPILIISIYKVQSLINVRSKKIQEKLSDLTTHAQEYYSGIRVLKSYVQEDFAIDFYNTQSKEYKTQSLRMARIEAFFFPLMILLIGLSTVLAVFVGGIKISEGLITPGNILEFVFYVNMLTWPISSVGWVVTLIQTAAASQKRINDFLKVKTNIVSNPENTIKFDGEIEFKDVSFVYPDTGIQAINDVSFKIRKGEKWAIIGKTGSGKSTLAELINRLYNVSSGEILASSSDINDINLAAYRSQIGYIPQDVFLFSDTIKNNIKFSDSNFSQEDVIAAAKKAKIHSEIIKFNESYDTIVGERGVTLSGGQKQRISMARALIKNPELFIFDDSLSALDTKTEKHILNNLDKSLKDKTVIIITHRIPKSIVFDNILVVEDGRILELGNHKELMDNEGYYSEIFRKQQEKA